MAKIKFGMFMTDARGKVGGQVFSKNRSGAFVRTKVTPTNAQTVRQSYIRNLLASLSQAWSTLSQSVRDGFDSAVNDWSKTDVFGDIRNPTGKNLFTRLNMNLENSGQAQVTAVPAKVEVPILEGTAVTLDVAAWNVAGASNVAGGVVVISATAPQSQGTKFYKGKYRQIGTVASSAFATYNAKAQYEAKFGVTPLTSNIGFEFKLIMPNGQNGVPLAIRSVEA